MKTFQIDLFDEEKLDEELEKVTSKKTNTKSKQELFVLEYIKSGLKNATKSAINAGYSEKTAKTQASRLLKNPQVKILLEREKKRVKKTLQIDADFIAKEAFEMLQVAKGEKSRSQIVKGKDYVGTTELKIYDGTEVKSSLELLGKLTGSFTEVKQVEHSFDVEDLKNGNLEDLLNKNI